MGAQGETGGEVVILHFALAQCTVDDLLVPYNNNPHGYRSQADGANITIGSSNNPSWLPGAETFIELAANQWDILPGVYRIQGAQASSVIWDYINYKAVNKRDRFNLLADINAHGEGECYATLDAEGQSFSIYKLGQIEKRGGNKNEKQNKFCFLGHCVHGPR